MKQNHRSKTRSAANSGKVTKIDWALRRLRNQAIGFLAGGDRSLRREVAEELVMAGSYSEVRDRFLAVAAGKVRERQAQWNAFMNHFFAHRVNRSA